jgi:ABC-type methionine transport system ATPase subunit
MPTRTLRLNYPPSLLRQPILHRLIKNSDLTVNILQAQISIEEGWLEVQMTGSQMDIERAEDWLRGEGIEVVTID